MAKSFTASQKGNTMGFIHCCGGLRKTRSFKLIPQDNFVLCEVDYLQKCPVCGHTTVQLTRINKLNEITTIRRTNKKAITFFNKLKSKILYEKEYVNHSQKNLGKFYLYYNEYGTQKRCYSNLSNMKLGLKNLI